MNHRDNLHATLPDEIAALAHHSNATIAEIFSVTRHPIMYTRTGYILRVHLMNFLTHRDKVVDFECPVSLIHGPNGAGKSSILQAIHFVLGGKAKNIRDNCEKFSNLKTVVCLKDTNENVQAAQCSVIAYFYHQGNSDFHGPIIALKRTVTNEIAAFSLCSQFPSSAKSTPKFERISLERAHSILVSMGHFPDNEITMVSQSRMKVLVRMKPVDRYKLFSTAVSFDEIETKLEKSQVSLENSIKDSMKISKHIKDLDHEMKHIVKKIKAMKEYYEADINLNKAGLKKLALSIQKQRVYVQNHRIDVEQAEKHELVQLSAEYERKKYAKTNMEPYLKRCNKEIEELVVRLDTSKDQLIDLVDKITTTKTKLDETARHINFLEMELRNEGKNIVLLKKDIAEHSEIISKSTYKEDYFSPPEKDEEHKRLEAEENALQVEFGRLQREKEKLELALLDANKQKEQRLDKERAVRERCERALGQLNYLQRTLELESTGATESEKCISSLHPETKSIYTRVNAESFSGGVVAPLAAYVWVKASSSELAPIIRRVIGPTLLSTIAYKDKTDENKLRNILGRSIQLINLLRSTTPTMDEYNALIHELDEKHRDKVVSVMQCLGSSSSLALEVLQLKVQLSRLVICDDVEIARVVLEIGKKLRVSFQCLPKDRECTMFVTNNNSVIMKPAYSNKGSTKAQSLYSATSNSSNTLEEIQYEQQLYEKAKAELEFNFSAEKISIMEAQEALKRSEIQAMIDSISAELAIVLQKIENNRNVLLQFKHQYAQTVESYNSTQKEMEKDRRQYENSRTIVDTSKSKLMISESKLDEMRNDLEKSNILLKDTQDTLSQHETLYTKCESDTNALENEITEKIVHRENIQVENLDKQINQMETAISACKAKIKTLHDFLKSSQGSVLNDLRTFLEVFENLSSLTPEYKEKQNKLARELLRGSHHYNHPNPDTDGHNSNPVEQMHNQHDLPFKELYAKELANGDNESVYGNIMTCIAFNLVDFIADYPVFAGGQDAKSAGSVPNTSHGDNEQLIITINNLLSDVSESIQRIEERKHKLAQNFSGDIEHEKQNLLEMEDTIKGLRKEHNVIKKDIASIGGLAVQQIIMLISTRSRAEHEISFHFQRTSDITGINQRLYFHFPELPTVSCALLGRIDEKLADKYNDICGAQVRASWGVEPPNKSISNISGPSDETAQQLITTVISSKGSIDIRSKTRGVTSLSGGESTFISLCFMFSCWLVIRTRYAQIDEWDVFMDAMRRKRAFKLMMDAILQTSVQVVLVTPSDVDISDLDDTTKKLIGVIKLLSIRN